MNRSIVCAALLATVLNAVAGWAQEKAKPAASKPSDEAKAPASLIGPWRAGLVTIAAGGGELKTLSSEDSPINVIFSKELLTLRVGDKILAETSYVLDRKKDPWWIDLKSADGVLLGICASSGKALRMSCRDAAEGRPGSFDEPSGLVLRLSQFPASRLFVMDADGGNRRLILSSPEFTALGSPDWSPDGNKIALDAFRTMFGEGCNTARVWVVNADGSGLRDLGPGAMPSWSCDGKRIVYTEYSPQRGIWLMNANGSGRQFLDGSGWAAQWSPKRNEIAYTVQDGSANICVNDLAKKTTRTLLKKSYRVIYWGLNWSSDGNWICYKADLPDGGSEIAAVHAEGEAKGFRVILPRTAVPEIDNAGCALAWGGNGSQILVTMQKKSDRTAQLYVFDSASDRPPQVFPGFPSRWGSHDMAWSSDGKRVAFTAEAPDVPWP